MSVTLLVSLLGLLLSYWVRYCLVWEHVCITVETTVRLLVLLLELLGTRCYCVVCRHHVLGLFIAIDRSSGEVCMEPMSVVQSLLNTQMLNYNQIPITKPDLSLKWFKRLNTQMLKDNQIQIIKPDLSLNWFKRSPC